MDVDVLVYRDGLLKDVLPFWIDHGVDQQHGGIMTSLDQQGGVIDTDKGVWQQGRFCWLLGELYNNVQQNPQWLDLAKSTAAFIEQCIDPADDRLWFHVTRDATPIRKRRYAFGEAFAAIAFGELAQATGEGHYRERATRMLQRFIDHNEQPAENPKFTDHRPGRNIGYPMILLNSAQQLRDSIGLDADPLIDRAIEQIVRYHVKDDIRCVVETVGVDGKLIDHMDGRTLNPGHAIEGAWFIMDEGRHRSDQQLIDLGCKMLQWMLERGWDDRFGGMLYFTSIDSRPISEYWQDMKFWWPHNETIIATLMAWLLTGNQDYARWHQKVHQWSYSHFPDQTCGEWFGYLRRDGEVSNTLKGNLWKGPFHLPRMQLVCWKLLEKYG